MEIVKFEKYQENGVSIVKIIGDMDHTNSMRVKNRIDEMLNGDEKRIIIDLEDVDYINSYGIGLLRAAKAGAERVGGDIALIHLEGRLRTILEMVGMDEVFSIFDSKEKAMELFLPKKK